MEGRLKRTEQKQQQMMNFLARAMQNPNFVHQLVQQKEWKKELEEAISKKRRRTIDQGPSSNNDDDGIELLVGHQFDCSDFVEELKPNNIIAAKDLDLIGKLEEEDQQHINEFVQVGNENIINREKDIINNEDEVFWQDLLSEDVEEVVRGFDEDDEEDVDVLAEQLGYLASNSLQ